MVFKSFYPSCQTLHLYLLYFSKRCSESVTKRKFKVSTKAVHTILLQVFPAPVAGKTEFQEPSYSILFVGFDKLTMRRHFAFLDRKPLSTTQLWLMMKKSKIIGPENSTCEKLSDVSKIYHHVMGFSNRSNALQAFFCLSDDASISGAAQ